MARWRPCVAREHYRYFPGARLTSTILKVLKPIYRWSNRELEFIINLRLRQSARILPDAGAGEQSD
jgi:hypothetical protein